MDFPYFPIPSGSDKNVTPRKPGVAPPEGKMWVLEKDPTGGWIWRAELDASWYGNSPIPVDDGTVWIGDADAVNNYGGGPPGVGMSDPTDTASTTPTWGSGAGIPGWGMPPDSVGSDRTDTTPYNPGYWMYNAGSVASGPVGRVGRRRRWLYRNL